MSTSKNGGRMTVHKFEQQQGSIMSSLQDLTPAQRSLYHANRKRHSEDARSIEAWASDGCASGLSSVGE